MQLHLQLVFHAVLKGKLKTKNEIKNQNKKRNYLNSETVTRYWRIEERHAEIQVYLCQLFSNTFTFEYDRNLCVFHMHYTTVQCIRDKRSIIANIYDEFGMIAVVFDI